MLQDRLVQILADSFHSKTLEALQINSMSCT